jgi:N-carbamoyl-L-amino-acid hydrolase
MSKADQRLSLTRIREAVHAEHARAAALFADFAACGPSASGIMRDTYGAGENRAHELLRATAARERLGVRTDFAANTTVTWEGQDRSAPRILIGSHLDSVPHGGNYDGAAGVVAGLIAIAALRALGFVPGRDVEVMGIRAEESIWFEVSYIGSRSALGTLPDGALDSARRIDTGRSLADHMSACGADVDAVRAGRRAIEPAHIAAFLEIHIEQAPALVEMDLPVAVCTAIPGHFRFPNAVIHGRHDHVGTPRRFRHDAAMAAADLAMALDGVWAAREAAGTPMAVTFGRFHTDAAAHGLTIVPGAFHFSLDIRAYDSGVLSELEAWLQAEIPAIEARRSVRIDLGRRASGPLAPMDAKIRSQLHDYARDLGVPVTDLGSPASHDAAAFNACGIPTAMLFVRNANGSHNPDEHMEIADFLEAVSLLACWIAEHA